MLYKFFVAVLCLAALPLQILIAVLLVVSSGVPILFVQKRVGKKGRIFVMYKFRTMRPGAAAKQSSLRPLNESDGPTFKIHHDPRFTPIGRFLSHTGLDELPQLWNVLRGEMGLIGPRPLPSAEAAKLAPWMRARHTVAPGIISPAILSGNYHTNFTAWMRSDVAYAKKKNLRTDVLLLVRGIVFLGRLFMGEIRSLLRA